MSATTTVKYRAFDNAGNAEAVKSQLIQIDSTAPTSSITCDFAACQSGFYNTAVSVALDAVDGGGSGVASIRYTTDGSDPTATTGNAYLGPFSVTSTATVKYRAFDNAGTAEPVRSKLIQIDSSSPASTISCNGALSPCSPSAYADSVAVSLAATDSGSGVAAIRYTTDGSTPSPANGTVYGAPFTVSETTTVKYRAYDSAGNVEPVNSQLIQVDSVAPTSTISCNGSPCASVRQRSSLGHARRHRQQRGLGCLSDPLHDQRHHSDGDDRQRLHQPVPPSRRPGLPSGTAPSTPPATPERRTAS